MATRPADAEKNAERKAKRQASTARAPRKTDAAEAPETEARRPGRPRKHVQPAVSVDLTVEVPALKLNNLLDQVAASTGNKKKDVKAVVEATLSALGEALSDGQELNMRPLGKVKLARRKTAGSNEVLILKLRRNMAARAAAKGLATGVAETGE